jgi:aldose sugar dehydrogenase
MKRTSWSAALFLVLSVGPVSATNQPPEGEPAAEAVSTWLVPLRIAGPFEFPWSIGFLPGVGILVTEKPGRLNLVMPNGNAKSIEGLPEILHGALGGLLDVAVDPNFVSNRALYLSYTHGSEQAGLTGILDRVQ